MADFNSKYTGAAIEEALEKASNAGTYSKPGSGIPKSDLAVDVQTSLEKANTAIQDVSGKMDKISVQNHGTSSTTLSISPNILHKWGTITKLTLTLATPTDTSVYNEYMVQFTSGTTPTTLSVPDTVKWVAEPNIEASKTYQISIVDNIGIIVGV